jgi:hypothetical protein
MSLKRKYLIFTGLDPSPLALLQSLPDSTNFLPGAITSFVENSPEQSGEFVS